MQKASAEAVLCLRPASEVADPACRMQKVFAELAVGNHGWCIPKGFWNAFRDYDGSPLDLREHQDAYEFFTRLQASHSAVATPIDK